MALINSQPLFAATNIVKRVFYVAMRVALPSATSFHFDSSFNTIEAFAILAATPRA